MAARRCARSGRRDVTHLIAVPATQAHAQHEVEPPLRQRYSRPPPHLTTPPGKRTTTTIAVVAPDGAHATYAPALSCRYTPAAFAAPKQSTTVAKAAVTHTPTRRQEPAAAGIAVDSPTTNPEMHS